MKILITGGAGYKGIILAESLLKERHKVTILDNFMYGYNPVLHLITNPDLEVVNKDIRNIEEADLKHYDAIFHLAGISGYPACEANPHSAQIINVDSTKSMLNKLSSKNQLLIYASTTSFYGKSGASCDEKSEIQPVSLYGITKYEAEKIVMSRENSIALRFATVFGISPKMRNDLLLNDFVYKAIHERTVVIFDGHSKRTFMHIRDAINGYMFALKNSNKMKGDVFNVGNENMNFSKTEIANAILKYVEYEIIDSTLPDMDIRSFNVSFKKLADLGYKTQYNLEDGINELVKLYKFYRQYTPFKVI